MQALPLSTLMKDLHHSRSALKAGNILTLLEEFNSVLVKLMTMSYRHVGSCRDPMITIYLSLVNIPMYRVRCIFQGYYDSSEMQLKRASPHVLLHLQELSVLLGVLIRVTGYTLTSIKILGQCSLLSETTISLLQRFAFKRKNPQHGFTCIAALNP